MKKFKGISLAVAALLTVAPVATISIANGSQAADAAVTNNQSNPIELHIDLKKPYITLTKGDLWDRDTIQNILEPNHGKIELVSTLTTFKKDKNGNVEWNNPVYENDLKNGDEGVIIAEVELEDLSKSENVDYSYDTKVDNSGDLVKVVTPSNDGYTYYNKDIAVKIPFVVGTKKTASNKNTAVVKTKHVKKAKKAKHTRRYRRGRITGRRNRRVRTYTSRGKFSHHYVYGRHSYKFNTRKVIKGKVYYKIYGKSQYVRASYIKF